MKKDGCAIKGALTAIAQGKRTMSQDEERSVSMEVDAISGFRLEDRIAWVL